MNIFDVVRGFGSLLLARTTQPKQVIVLLNTTRKHVVCNMSLSDYMQPNITCDYKWLPMQLLFKFGWNLVFVSTKLRLWPISSINCVIFYNIVYTFSCKCKQDNHMLIV
jgi:hypothetical protein